MLEPGWLNLGSLVLGLIAWLLPVLGLIRHHEADGRRWIVLSVASVSACAISLWMQICYGNHLAIVGDWSALMDTSRAVAVVATLLLIGTIILNSAALVVHHRIRG